MSSDNLQRHRRKSSRSQLDGSGVEVATNSHGWAVRDSKLPHGDVVVFGAEPFRVFVRILG
jgi:hypothetical protein